ncbi:acetylcholinesterase-like [Glandiceps talaboti]
MKASHGEELQYVFGFVFMDDMNWSVTDDEVKMTLQIMRYWANFAKTGNPNTPADETENSDENKVTIWPSYAIPGRNFKKLSPEMLNGKAFKLKECVFWNQLVPKNQLQGLGIMKKLNIQKNVTDHDVRIIQRNTAESVLVECGQRRRKQLSLL